MSEWISVAEKRPMILENVLVTNEADCYAVVTRHPFTNDYECCESGELIDWVPFHWMPLPEPPNA